MAYSKFKVALIQLHPKLLDPAFNFAAAERHIRDAASQGATLAVLPEYHLTGWAPEDPRFAEIANSASEYLTKYQALARGLRINIVPGTMVVCAPKQHDDDTNTGASVTKTILLNNAYFISETGELPGSYTKANLWHSERAYLTSGPDALRGLDPPVKCHNVFQTPLGSVGLLICYDLFFPEGFRALVRAGARIIIVPTFTKADDMSAEGLACSRNGEALFIQCALVTRAIENTCCVIFCNVGGPAEDSFVGLSQVAMPIVGKLPGGFDNCEPGMRIVAVDMGVCDIADRNYRILEDLGRKDFHYVQ